MIDQDNNGDPDKTAAASGYHTRWLGRHRHLCRGRHSAGRRHLPRRRKPRRDQPVVRSASLTCASRTCVPATARWRSCTTSICRVGKAAVAVPHRTERRRQVDHPALDLRLHATFFSGTITVGDEGAQRRRHSAQLQQQAQGCGHRLHPAGQVGVPRHDGGRESVDGRLPDGFGRRGASEAAETGVSEVRSAGRAPQESGPYPVRRRTPACWRFRARW